MNTLFVGLNKDVQLPPMRYLFIHDELPDLSQSRVFDPTKHSFNPLHGINDVRARELADALYTISPQGQNTLAVKEGRRALMRAFLSAPSLDKITISKKVLGGEDAQAMLDDLLLSPVLRKVFCTPRSEFSFNPNSIILARLNRKELGDFVALVLGLFLINRFKGQLVIPDFGFYGRDAHISLVRENRLIAGVTRLSELPLQLRQEVLLIKDRHASGALFEDAKVLAEYAGLHLDPTREDNPYNAFIKEAIS